MSDQRNAKRRRKCTRQPLLFKFTDLKKFTDRLSTNFFLNLQQRKTNLTTPNYVATLPCNLSLIACFLAIMFHKVVWQHMQDVVGFLITTLLQIYQGIFQRKKLCRSVKNWQNYGREFVALLFGPPCS